MMITIIGTYVNIRSKWSSFYKFLSPYEFAHQFLKKMSALI